MNIREYVKSLSYCIECRRTDLTDDEIAYGHDCEAQ